MAKGALHASLHRRTPASKVEAPSSEPNVVRQPSHPLLESLPQLGVGVVQVGRRTVVVACRWRVRGVAEWSVGCGVGERNVGGPRRALRRSRCMHMVCGGEHVWWCLVEVQAVQAVQALVPSCARGMDVA
eukprot:364437-Chlamydomonas_euryale.AAC.9